MLSVPDYVASLKSSPGLLDLVASLEKDQNEDLIQQGCIYPPHIGAAQITQGVKVRNFIKKNLY